MTAFCYKKIEGLYPGLFKQAVAIAGKMKVPWKNTTCSSYL
jgi:hypothetical protein